MTEAKISPLESAFRGDLRKIAEALVGAFELSFSGDISNLSDPMLRWLDFRLRYVELRQRTVIHSKKFPGCIPPDAKAALDAFTGLAEKGGDLNPFQSKGLIMHNDTSGAKKQKRTDMLWASWGLLHFHLTTAPIPAGKYFAARSSWLVFAVVDDESIGLIDIRHHDDEDLFSDVTLVEAIADSWPEYMSQFELKGVLGSNVTLQSADYAKLWKAGVSTGLNFGGKAYMGPGYGLTSASTPLKVTMAMDRITRDAVQLAGIVEAETGIFKSYVNHNSITEPRFHLTITAQGLAVCEEKSNCAWLLPGNEKDPQNNFLAGFVRVLLPGWAVDMWRTKNPSVEILSL